MRRVGLLSFALAVALTAPACSKSQSTADTSGSASPAVGTAGKTEVTRGDKNFVHDVAIANMAEVDLGRLAADRGTDTEVKKFGQMMVDDHTKASDTLKTVASQYSIEVPTSLDDKHSDLREKLTKKQGFEFDRDYIDAMVDGHKDVLDKLESRIDKAKLAEWKTQEDDRLAAKKAEVKGEALAILPEKSDNAVTASINQWAADTYPTVYAHLYTAKGIQTALKRRTTN